MTFTIEQLNALSAWEDNMSTAVKAQWARNPGRAGLQVIWDIYTKATGDQRRFNDNCNHCILSLLQDCGRLYFKDKEELEARSREVAVSDQPAKTVRKKKITTKK